MRVVAVSTSLLSLVSLATAAAVTRDRLGDLIVKFTQAEVQWKKGSLNTSYVLAGDSTTANGTTPNSGGWGNGFCASLVPGTPCINRARNGATTVSFRDGGNWNLTIESAKSEVTSGRKTWVTIQFDHNDMKVMTAAAMGANLATFVDEVRAVGAEPILITSLTRRNFNADNVTLNDTLEPWANATIAISQEKKTPLLDLHKWSMWYVEKIGPDAAHRLNRLPDDNTHLNTNGTTVFGRMVADLMAVELLPEIGPILPNISLSLPIWTGKAVY
ncbi:Rhamnogalacturonan acetylesterase RhgT OS=Bacillus subtilis (strain 168) GN=rhgT PE=1 SV=1 [Rhizoctonia solani AG-1 IB]|uniref:Rhamnogalacturonan acetylesterase RhgT n=1 Tax=Thanatephorus cucumeris (strain AG1-IB / isolate 7/3/14) TaxID=1108050 RepID=A0A0B7FFC9_THACB|nr:Rhamnogalacturonan acetylesterase RhgT OS=Bacillus subtilis (strain 168) GN=rhgT PE=1 SV=1 [Rhizoctonia solani AG-1 IB]